MARHALLEFSQHAHLKVRSERSAAFGDNIMSAPVFPHEMRSLQPHYPLVFMREKNSEAYRPIALLGLEREENLFLTEAGWGALYVPLAIRMRPFLIGRGKDVNTLQIHIDLDHPRVSEIDGEALFTSEGEETEIVKSALDVLKEVHMGEQSVAPFCALLDELELIEPFTLDVTLKNGKTGQLAGLFTVAEEKLYALEGAALSRLQNAGYLQSVFMMVASLSQFAALIERKNNLVEDLI